MSSYSATQLHPGQVLDGYVLLRAIGEGGFGQVWLCRNESTNEHLALKWISRTKSGHLEQEMEALVLYREGLRKIPCPNLLSIEHVRLVEGGLFYVMPLADGSEGAHPEAPEWYPYTLAAFIEEYRAHGSWFSSEQIRFMVSRIVEAARCLGTVGLVHRDIKPENVIYFRGEPCLSDCGLTTVDATQVSRKGTPVYLAPSWYVENSGNPDMWGCACLLYVLLTGNPPDKMGKAGYIWPPSGEASLPEDEKMEWRRLHQVVYRATAEHPEERYLGFDRFLEAIHPDQWIQDEPVFPSPEEKVPWVMILGGILTVAVLLGIVWMFLHKRSPANTVTETSSIVPSMNTFTQRATEVEKMISRLEMEYKEGKSKPAGTDEVLDGQYKPFLDSIQTVSESQFDETLGKLKEIHDYLTANKSKGRSAKDIPLPPLYAEVQKAVEALKESAGSLDEKNSAQTLFMRYWGVKSMESARFLNGHNGQIGKYAVFEIPFRTALDELRAKIQSQPASEERDERLSQLKTLEP